MGKHGTKDDFYLAQITVLVVVHVITLILCSKQCRICREPFLGQLEIREQYLSKLVDGNDTIIINNVHMNKSSFFNLCLIMRQKVLMRVALHITNEKQQLMFLHIIRHIQCNRPIA